MVVAEHLAQAPLLWQAGVGAPQSQTGVVPPQSALPRHATHTPLVISHRGLPPVQRVVFVAEHSVQAPLAKQAGLAPPHSESPAQARQVATATSQMGFVPP